MTLKFFSVFVGIFGLICFALGLWAGFMVYGNWHLELGQFPKIVQLSVVICLSTYGVGALISSFGLWNNKRTWIARWEVIAWLGFSGALIWALTDFNRGFFDADNFTELLVFGLVALISSIFLRMNSNSTIKSQ